jgi:hypothetical protein
LSAAHQEAALAQSLIDPCFQAQHQQLDTRLRTLEVRLEGALAKHTHELRREIYDAVSQLFVAVLVVATASFILLAGLLSRLRP